MTRKIDLKLFRSGAMSDMPKQIRSLLGTALFLIEGPGEDRARMAQADYALIEDMVRESLALAGEKFGGRVWMIVLCQRIIEQQEALRQRWPSPIARHEGKIYSRTIFERVFASVAVWRIELSMRALRKNNQRAALDEIAIAGMALYFAGSVGAGELAELQQVDERRKGAEQRWVNDPTQKMKGSIRNEWNAWQKDRALYRYPRDFRNAMLNKYPQAVDGTLRNWMSEWGRS